ncbi:MAG: hypothetical protein DRG30_01450 [Epsilonproteobacteria bacterium]|nr:MAG: hypothetical protein DRG30_01450 [Campylobacterota bacterium]
MNNYERWTDEKIHKKALKYNRPIDFKKNETKAYNVAQQRGILKSVCSHMIRKIDKFLSDDELIKIAKEFNTKAEFREKYPSARQVIRRRQLEKEAYSHMTSKREYKKPDNDTIYIWKAIGIKFNNKQVYKIGVTSFRRGIQRITEVSKKSSIRAEIIEIKEIKEALRVEQSILNIGEDPKIIGFRGCTEFRAMNDSELDKAKEIISNWH